MSHLRFEWTVPLNAHLNSVFSPWDFWPVDKQWCSFLLLFTSSDKVGEAKKQNKKTKTTKAAVLCPKYIHSLLFISCYFCILTHNFKQFPAVWPTLLLRERERGRARTVAIKHAQELMWHLFWSFSDSFSAIISGLCQSETVFEFVAGFHALRNSVVCVCYSFITSWCSRGRAPCSTRPWRLWSVQTKV